MSREIIFGQYEATDSVLHRLDPRVKLLGVLLYSALIFFCSHVLTFTFSGVMLLLLIALSGVSVGKLAKSLRPVLAILLVSVSFTVLFTGGNQILFRWGIIQISVQGLLLAAKISVRIFLLILMSELLTLTTRPTDIADGLEKACHFLTKAGVPVHEIAMMLTIALRFIPVLSGESDKLIRAQRARGADFESCGLIEKGKKLLPLFIPLVVSAVRRSVDLANAMEARCYRGGAGRTKMKPLHYEKRDYAAYGVLMMYAAVMILMEILIK